MWGWGQWGVLRFCSEADPESMEQEGCKRVDLEGLSRPGERRARGKCSGRAFSITASQFCH